MQGLNIAPRELLSAAVVTSLLQGSSVVEVGYGALHLDANLNVIDDISEYMSAGSTINSSSSATIHRSCQLNIDSDAPVDYFSDFIQPYMMLTNPDTGDTATFYRGVYTMTTPVYDNSALPTVLSITGYDLLSYLNQAVGDSYVVNAGADPVTSAIEVVALAFPAATVDFTETTSTLTHDMVWPSGASDPYNSQNSQITYLAIINDLLAQVGYAPVWVDWNGVFQMHPYVAPLDRTIEWEFDVQDAEDGIVADPRTSQQDWFDTPNQWQFIITNLNAAPVEGETQFTYQDNSPDNPSSIQNRGGRIISKVVFIAAADFDSLVLLATQQIILDLMPAETISITTSPFPLAWHYDLVGLTDQNLVNVPPLLTARRLLLGLTWQETLDGSADTAWTFQTVTQ